MADKGSVALTTSDTLAARKRAFNLSMKMGFFRSCVLAYKRAVQTSQIPVGEELSKEEILFDLQK